MTASDMHATRSATENSPARVPASASSVRYPLTIAADHPAYAGHFPGQPIAPGVLLLDLSLRALAQHLAQHCAQLPADAVHRPAGGSLAMVKFLRPVLPGTPLSVTLTPTRTGWQLQVHDEVALVASAQWTPPQTSSTAQANNAAGAADQA